MGSGGVDILLSRAAKEAFPFSVECKNQEAIGPLYKFWEQTSANAGAETPLLVVKKNREKPLVILDAETFFGLLKGI